MIEKVTFAKDVKPLRRPSKVQVMIEKSPDELLATLDPAFYTEEFDPVKQMLMDLPMDMPAKVNCLYVFCLVC